MCGTAKEIKSTVTICAGLSVSQNLKQEPQNL